MGIAAQRRPVQALGPRVGGVALDERVERARFGAQLDGTAGVVEDGFDLAAVADDAGIGQQPGDVVGAESTQGLGVEVREGAAEVFALAENGQPGEAGLEAFEAELLEQVALVAGRPAPLVIVIGHVERVVAAPGAADHAVRAGTQALRHAAYEVGPIGQVCSNLRPSLSSTWTTMGAGASAWKEKVKDGSSESAMSPSTSSTGVSPMRTLTKRT